VVDTIKPLILHGLPLTYFEEFISQLRDVSPQQIQAFAESYLPVEEMVEVVLG
jgi:predicted Zn-dependent peptidase